MKLQIKKIVTPFAIAMIAVIGAFAGNTSNQEESAYADRFGYRKIGDVCIPTSTVCSNLGSPFLCTDGVNTLYDFNGSSCPDVLFQKMD